MDYARKFRRDDARYALETAMYSVTVAVAGGGARRAPPRPRDTATQRVKFRTARLAKFRAPHHPHEVLPTSESESCTVEVLLG